MKTNILLLLIIGVILSFSFKAEKHGKSIVGVWQTDSHMKVFLGNGEFMEIRVSGMRPVVSHSGTYKILDDNTYVEEVIDQRQGGKYALEGNRFKNSYAFSADKRRVRLSGKVYTHDGRDSLSWGHIYTKMNVEHLY